MSRRKQRSAFDQVSEFGRGRIVAYRGCGLSFREIGSRVGRNQTTVMRICDRWIQEGTTDRRGHHLSAPLHQSGLSARRPLLGLPLTQNHRRLLRQWCDEKRILHAEIVEVEIEVVSPSIVPSGNFAELNRTVTCMVLKANDRRTSCPCHDEFRGPRSDYVRQVASENNNNKHLSRAETSSRWCSVVVRRGGCQLRCRPRHLTMVQNYVVRRQKPSCS
ncbi:transposable element Tcb1 transposase [Trichonephila clavipes]|nr:transposable element Tcb1 transposase [Trichonephila clavipes]